MANPMIAMQAALTLSRKASSAAQRSRAALAAIPTARAKNMTAKRPLPLELASMAPTISWKGFSGIRSRRVSLRGLAARAPAMAAPAAPA